MLTWNRATCCQLLAHFPLQQQQHPPQLQLIWELDKRRRCFTIGPLRRGSIQRQFVAGRGSGMSEREGEEISQDVNVSRRSMQCCCRGGWRWQGLLVRLCGFYHSVLRPDLPIVWWHLGKAQKEQRKIPHAFRSFQQVRDILIE